MPSPIDRRTFLAGMAGAAIGGAAAGLLGPYRAFTPQSTAALPDMKLYTTGRHGRLYPGQHDSFDRNMSVLTELDIRTGKVRQATAPIDNAHYVVAMPARDNLLMVVQQSHVSALFDGDMQLKRLISLPAEFNFSGHGIHLPEKNVIFLSTYSKGDGLGLIQIYDDTSLELLDEFPSGGIRPHDMSLFNDGTRIALAQAGNQRYGRDTANRAATSEDDLYTPKLTIIDIASRSTVRHMPIAVQAPMVHLAVDRHDNVYSVLQKYIDTSAQRNTDDIRAEMKRYFPHGLPDNFNPLDVEPGGEGIAVPMPFMRFDTTKDRITEIFSSANEQRRSQSVILQQQTGLVIAAYVFSEHLLCVREDQSHFTVHTPSFGIQDPIGLCDIAGTPYFAVAGMFEDIAIIDARNMRPVQHFHEVLYRCSHLTPVMSA